MKVFTKHQMKKEKILEAYSWLTNKIKEYQKNKKIVNYNNTFQGKLHNAKDEISWEMVKEIYLNNNFISNCHAEVCLELFQQMEIYFHVKFLKIKNMGI